MAGGAETKKILAMLVLVIHLYYHVLMCHDVLLYHCPWVLSEFGEIQQKLDTFGDFCVVMC